MSKRILSKALTDDGNQISGFTLQELARISHRSIQECEIMEQTLMKALAKDKPRIKLKVLRCVKFLSEQGRDNFKLSMQHNTGEIRRYTKYTGPPDPLYGDRQYAAVREAAKEAIAALFSTTSQKQHFANNMTGHGGFSGGDSAATSSSGGSGGGYRPSSTFSGGAPSSKYSGFANPAYAGNAAGADSGGILSKIAGKISEKTGFDVGGSAPGPANPASPFSSGRIGGSGGTYGGPQGAGRYSGYGGGGSGGGGGSTYSGGGSSKPPPPPPPGSRNPEESTSGDRDRFTMPSRRKGGQVRKQRRGQVGGKWAGSDDEGDEDDEPVSRRGGGGGSVYAPAASASTSRGGGGASASRTNNESRGSGVAAEDEGHYEKALVEKITAPTGVRLAPEKAIMDDFLRKFESLNQEVVCDFVMDALESSKQQTRVKSLFVMEALLNTEFSEDVKALFLDAEDTLMDLTNANHRQTRNKANQVAVLLGIIDKPSRRRGSSAADRQSSRAAASAASSRSKKATAATVAAPAQEVDDILDLGVETAQPVPPANNAAVDSTTALFSQLNVAPVAEEQANPPAAAVSDDPIESFMATLPNAQSASKPPKADNAPQSFDPLSEGFLAGIGAGGGGGAGAPHAANAQAATAAPMMDFGAPLLPETNAANQGGGGFDFVSGGGMGNAQPQVSPGGASGSLLDNLMGGGGGGANPVMQQQPPQQQQTSGGGGGFGFVQQSSIPQMQQRPTQSWGVQQNNGGGFMQQGGGGGFMQQMGMGGQPNNQGGFGNAFGGQPVNQGGAFGNAFGGSGLGGSAGGPTASQQQFNFDVRAQGSGRPQQQQGAGFGGQPAYSDPFSSVGQSPARPKPKKGRPAAQPDSFSFVGDLMKS